MNKIINKEKTINDYINKRRDGTVYILARNLSDFLGYSKYSDFLAIIHIVLSNYHQSQQTSLFSESLPIVEFRDFDDNLGDRIEINPDFIKVRKKVKAGVSYKYKYELDIDQICAFISYNCSFMRRFYGKPENRFELNDTVVSPTKKELLRNY